MNSGTFQIAPYLTVRKRAHDGALVFTIGNIAFDSVPTHLFHPSSPKEATLVAKDYGEGAEVPIPAGRMSALYEWFATTHPSAA